MRLGSAGFGWIAFVAACAPACSDDNSGRRQDGYTGGGSGGAGAVGAGGFGRLMNSGGSQPNPAADFGRVTVAGASDAVPTTTHSFFGSAHPENGNDLVRIRAYLQADASGPARVEVTAGSSGHLLPDVVAWFAVSGNTTFTKSFSFDETSAPDFSLHARLTYDDPASFYEYEYSYAVGSSPPVRSYCLVTLDEIGMQRVSGSIECRDLFATYSSADYAGPDSGNAIASVTLLFSATPEVIDSGPSGVGGAPPAGGAPGNGGAAAAHCSGVATPCTLLTHLECSSALGCSGDGECQGVSTSCYSEFDSYGCDSQDGCYWSSSSSSCSGSSTSCSLELDSYSCGSQDGCTWKDTCSGSALACDSLFSEVGCTNQPGCYWVP